MKGKTRRELIDKLAFKNVRTDLGSEEDLMALGASYLKRPIHPILARRGPPVTIIDGNRRIAGMKLHGETEVDVFVIDDDITDADTLEIAFTTAMHRADLNAYSKACVIRDFAAMHSGITSKEIAEKFHCDPSMITRLASLWKTPLEVQKAAAENKIVMSGWYQISQAKPESQLGLFNAMQQSHTSASAVEAARKKRQKPTDAPKQARCVWQDSAGTKVTVTAGDGLDLQGFIDALTSALEAARKANRETLDIKTAMKVWADKARA